MKKLIKSGNKIRGIMLQAHKVDDAGSSKSVSGEKIPMRLII